METQQQEPPAPTPPTPILSLPPNVTIRPYHTSDAPSISRAGNSKAVWNNLRNRMPHPYLESNALQWISHCNDPTNAVATGPWDPRTGSGTEPKIPTHYTIAIADQAVGAIGLEFGDTADVYARCAELGYWLSQDYWGQGIMRAVVPAFVEWSWRTFGILVRLNAEVDTGNVGSMRCLERAGLKVEGRREKAVLKNGVLRDVVLMGMVRAEREEVR